MAITPPTLSPVSPPNYGSTLAGVGGLRGVKRGVWGEKGREGGRANAGVSKAKPEALFLRLSWRSVHESQRSFFYRWLEVRKGSKAIRLLPVYVPALRLDLRSIGKYGDACRLFVWLAGAVSDAGVLAG